ncbi:hypothetical protein D3C87_1827940 [compost metagenome]
MQRVLEARTGLASALHAKREQARHLAAQVLLRQGVVGVVRQAGVVDPFHLRVFAQEVRDLHRVFNNAVHAQRQRFDALQNLERVER